MNFHAIRKEANQKTRKTHIPRWEDMGSIKPWDCASAVVVQVERLRSDKRLLRTLISLISCLLPLVVGMAAVAAGAIEWKDSQGCLMPCRAADHLRALPLRKLFFPQLPAHPFHPCPETNFRQECPTMKASTLDRKLKRRVEEITRNLRATARCSGDGGNEGLRKQLEGRKPSDAHVAGNLPGPAVRVVRIGRPRDLRRHCQRRGHREALRRRRRVGPRELGPRLCRQATARAGERQHGAGSGLSTAETLGECRKVADAHGLAQLLAVGS